MDTLNFDIINLIYSELDYIDIINVSKVNKYLYNMFIDNKKHIISKESITYYKVKKYNLLDRYENIKISIDSSGFFDNNFKKYVNNITILRLDEKEYVPYLPNMINLKKLLIYININFDISNLIFLEELYICGISIINIDSLKYLTKLKFLLLNKCEIKDSSSLEKLTNMRRLEICSSEINSLSFLKNMKYLNHITFYNSTFNKKINYSFVKYLINLKYLNLCYTKNFKYECLKNITSLEILYLTRTKIKNLKSLSPLVNLKTLFLSCLLHNEELNLIPLKTLGKKNKLKIYINETLFTNEELLIKNPNILFISNI